MIELRKPFNLFNVPSPPHDVTYPGGWDIHISRVQLSHGFIVYEPEDDP